MKKYQINERKKLEIPTNERVFGDMKDGMRWTILLRS
ncbi:hypothetical protein ABIA69_000538 [Lysinibacillus parviboronicapiens]|uniref:Uncharacterized protein n=1 Tax=Lysinibacillus parviboronicapiens TaxID=436516 RepID=A0ABV2PEL8_9BACI